MFNIAQGWRKRRPVKPPVKENTFRKEQDYE